MVASKKATGRQQWPVAQLAQMEATSSQSYVHGATLAMVVKETFFKVGEAKVANDHRTNLALQMVDSLTDQVLAVMTEDAEQFRHYESLQVLTAEGQQARNAMRGCLSSTAKEVVTKTRQILLCLEEPQNDVVLTKKVIEEAYDKAATAGDDLKEQLREQKAAIVAKLDQDFLVALQQVDVLKESLVAQKTADLLQLTEKIPMQRECGQPILVAFGLAASFLQKLKVEETDEGQNMKVEDDKKLEEIKIKEERFARMNMDFSRSAYVELLHEKQGIVDWRTKHEEKMREHEQLSAIISSVRRRTEKVGVDVPPAKKRRLWFWQGA